MSMDLKSIEEQIAYALYKQAITPSIWEIFEKPAEEFALACWLAKPWWRRLFINKKRFFRVHKAIYHASFNGSGSVKVPMFLREKEDTNESKT